jgi:hypothetical protein
MNRDPRIDPQPGDSISRNFATAIGGVIIRDVTRAHGGAVFFRRDNGYIAKHQIVSLDEWRRWAAKAEVVDVNSVRDFSAVPRLRVDPRKLMRLRKALLAATEVA